LGYDILNARYDSLKYERRNLAVVLFSIAQLGYLSSHEIEQMVEWLSANSNHAMTYYILTALLTAFDPVDPQTFAGDTWRKLALDKSIMTFMAKKLDPTTEWKDPGLKAAILLKWTLFLTETRHQDPSLEHREGFKTEELETQIWNAVQGGVFTFLALAVLQLQRKRGISPATSFTSTLSIPPEQELLRDLPTDEFKPVVLRTFETLIRSLVTHASSELRKIKQRQEDLVLASARSDRTRMFRSELPATGTRFSSGIGPDLDKSSPAYPRSDIAMLYSFIGLLYSALPPERALQFWGSEPQTASHPANYFESVETTAGKLPAFLQWAVWSTQVRDVDMTMSLYDMLAGLANGKQCSELAYNFMARGAGEVIAGSVLPSAPNQAHYNAGPTVSWSVIFGVLESWSSPSASARQTPAPAAHTFGFSSSQSWPNQALPLQQPQQQLRLGPQDVLLARSFLRLLSTVVTHSVAVRVAIAGHTHFRAIPMLLSLVPLGIPLELKGAIFETLAAFCEPGAGIPGVEICRAVWTLMERLEVINVRGTSGFGTGSSLLPSVKGVEVELEEVEAAYRMYPATIPFLKLLSTLIHTPKRVPFKDRVAEAEPIHTMPEGLGQPYRLPGIRPFISFVVDNVFSNISNREYLCPSDRWHTNDLCLCFIERVLASYDLESLMASIDDMQFKGEFIIPLLVHPGYDIMTRMLTNSPLRTSILSYIIGGLEGFEKELAEEEPYFRNTIIRVLRIVHRVLEIQDIFLDVIVPLQSEFDCASIIGTAHSRSDFTRLDQALSFGPRYFPAIAAYVAYPAHPELVLLSIKVVTALSSSHAFANLTALIERSDDSERILSGYKQIVGAETMEDVTVAEAIADQTTGAGAPDTSGTPESLEQAIRLAALDLFIQNTEYGRTYPNIAHFLLFGGTNAEEQIQDPHALGARTTCIHVILDLLNAGVPRVKGKGKTRDRNHCSPLFVSLPRLAERCYRVIYQLCAHPRTSDFTMRYLRTREDFFTRQLAAIPSKVPATSNEPPAEVLYNDGSRITTTISTLCSFMRLRSWIFDLVALDLHVLTHKGHFKAVTELLEILFGNDSDYPHESTGWEDDLLQPFREVGQSHLRIIEFIQSLNFDWSDSLTVKPVDLQFLAQLNLQSCIRVDLTGCEIIDRTALISLLMVARRALHAQGNVVTPAHVGQLGAETVYILESCAIENHRREVRHAIAASYEAWRRLLDMALTKCFTRLPHDRRENMLFDLLHVLPGTIRSKNIQESTATLLSETTLSLMTKLRENRRHQSIIQSAVGNAEADSLPAERLYALLRSILDCILDSNHSELVRGNLYAALINYLHLITSAATITETLGEQQIPLPAPTTRDPPSDGQPVVTISQLGGFKSSTTSLETSILAVMKSGIERLVATISGDAIDGTEVWKTIAFMLLDYLVQISRLEKQHVVLSALIRHGTLANFVRGIKESDSRLQSVLRPDPGNVLMYLVFSDIQTYPE
jgi:nuclear pore complex protein Nup205